MPIPKTNLFKGDRVRINPTYLTSLRIRNIHSPIGKLPLDRIGTIISDTLDPAYDCIVVWWDGNAKPQRRDRGYMPCDLILVEEEEHAVQEG